MPCENSTCHSPLSTLLVTTTESDSSGIPTTDGDGEGDGEVGVGLARVEVVLTLCVAVLAVACNGAVLAVSRLAGGTQSPAMVFVRMLCLADLLLGCYGAAKMLMFLFLDTLLVNFFLPESLFFTATTANCLSLLLLNVDRAVKMAAPLWYHGNVDKASIITGMVFLWNASFVLGFLPLLGWNAGPGVAALRLSRFLAASYLAVLGSLWLAALAATVALLVYGRRCLHPQQPQHPQHPQHPGQHLREVRQYWQLRVTVVVEVVTWSLCYLPYLSLLCLACVRGQGDLDPVLYHFVAVFMLRALGGAGLQLYRTLHVMGLATPKRRHGNRHPDNHKGVAAISYSNPLCEASVTECSTVDDSLSLQTSPRLHHHLQQQQHSEGISYCNPLCDTMDCSTVDDSLSLHRHHHRHHHHHDQSEGIANPAFRPSIQIELGQGVLGVTEENTAL